MKVGDLVKYNFSEAPRTDENPYNIERGEVGVVVSFDSLHDDDAVANILFFAANYVKKSFTIYLEIISNA